MSVTSLASVGSLARALGLGVIAGSRSMLAPALFSQTARHKYALVLRESPFAPLAWDEVSEFVRFLSIGEIAADKLPILPDRTAPLPLFVRVVSGALVGGAYAAGEKGTSLVGSITGAAGAVLGAHADSSLRKEGARRGIPDPVLALAEDAIAIGAGIALLRS